MNGLIGKVVITGKLKVLTGMHIGGSSDYSGIGAVDSVVVRDVMTRTPYIPGSSLKGKLRYLTARCMSDNGVMKAVDKEAEGIKRLYGSGGKDIQLSRLQFYDLFINGESIEKLKKVDTGLYLTEIKFENTINRVTAVANPRQIERVPAGTVFDFKLVYNIEKQAEMKEDLMRLKAAMELLEMDYLGGHGTRGYGRVAFAELKPCLRFYDLCESEQQQVKAILGEVGLGEV